MRWFGFRTAGLGARGVGGWAAASGGVVPWAGRAAGTVRESVFRLPHLLFGGWPTDLWRALSGARYMRAGLQHRLDDEPTCWKGRKGEIKHPPHGGVDPPRCESSEWVSGFDHETAR